MPRSKKGPEDASPEKKTAAKKVTASRAKKSTSKSVETSVAAATPVASKVASPAVVVEQAKRNPQPADVEHEIRVRAYQFFLERNGGHGDPQQDWFRAEAEVRAKLIA